MLTQDPLGLAGGVNLYEYAGSNPVSFDDPFGLCPECKKLRERVEGKVTTTSPGLVDPVAILAGGISGGGRALLSSLASRASGSGTATFFRGVSQAEAADVAATGALRAGASAAGNTGKYLTNTVEAAAEWGAMNGPGSQVLKITVQADATKVFTSLGRIDGLGQAWWAPMEALKGAAVEVVEQAAKVTVP